MNFYGCCSPATKALGSPPVASSGPSTAAERVTFSSVARLGFAAGHDSQDTGATGNLPIMSLASSFRKSIKYTCNLASQKSAIVVIMI